MGVGPRVLTCKGGEGGCEAVIEGSTSPRDRQSLDVLCVRFANWSVHVVKC